MATDGTFNGHHGVTLGIEKEVIKTTPKASSSPFTSQYYYQKLLAELFATYFLIFAGCGVILVNDDKGVVGTPGIAIVWGTVVMVMVYTVGHVSGGHFNPAVTIAFATCKRFPWKEVPGYMIAQILASVLASGTLRLVLSGKQDHFVGNAPTGSDLQSLVMEIIITFYLMFVICAVVTDDRASGQLAGVAIGSTVLLNAMFAGAVSGASMNPARSLGPAIIWNNYTKLWIYILGPIIGAIAGAWAYNSLRFTDKPMSELTKGAC